mgnify:CR=1 FL=1
MMPTAQRRLLFLLLALLSAASVLAAAAIGSVSLGWDQWWSALTGPASEFGELVWRLRLPRAAAAWTVGALLSLSGCLMQVLLRNPLADPYILGVSGGASFAALCGMSAGVAAALSPALAWAGALLSILIVFSLARGEGPWSGTRLLLTGVVVATGWSERYATLGRSYTRMQDAFGHILARLPFPILELHPDNGSEFFNAYLLEFWAKEVASAHLTRSRPFHKNDNRFVEQRNSSEVRAYFGTHRLDTTSQVWCANLVYDKLWVYYNLFQPILRLVEKTVIPKDDGSFTTKLRHDAAKTPFDRLCATGVLADDKRIALERLRDQTNPRRLRQEIYELLERTLALPCAEASEAEPTSSEGGTAR